MVYVVRIEEGPLKGKVYSVSDCKVRALHLNQECAWRIARAHVEIMEDMPSPDEFFTSRRSWTTFK